MKKGKRQQKRKNYKGAKRQKKQKWNEEKREGGISLYFTCYLAVAAAQR